MFELVVCGVDEAKTLMSLGWPTHIASLLSPMDQNAKSTGKNHLMVLVDDVVHNGGYSSDFKYDVPEVPAKKHLQAVFDFTSTLTDQDRLLVHCAAGVSRSTAVAIGVLIQHGMPFHEALNYVKTIRPILRPNEKFIELIDSYFKLNKKLIQHYSEWKRRTIFSQNSSPTILLPGDISHITHIRDFFEKPSD